MSLKLVGLADKGKWEAARPLDMEKPPGKSGSGGF